MQWASLVSSPLVSAVQQLSGGWTVDREWQWGLLLELGDKSGHFMIDWAALLTRPAGCRARHHGEICGLCSVHLRDTWNAVRKEETKVSKLLRLERLRNFPPKSWAPRRANIEMKSKRSRRRLLIDDMLPSRELTSRDMDLQYLGEGIFSIYKILGHFSILAKRNNFPINTRYTSYTVM